MKEQPAPNFTLCTREACKKKKKREREMHIKQKERRLKMKRWKKEMVGKCKLIKLGVEEHSKSNVLHETKNI